MGLAFKTALFSGVPLTNKSSKRRITKLIDNFNNVKIEVYFVVSTEYVVKIRSAGNSIRYTNWLVKI